MLSSKYPQPISDLFNKDYLGLILEFFFVETFDSHYNKKIILLKNYNFQNNLDIYYSDEKDYDFNKDIQKLKNIPNFSCKNKIFIKNYTPARNFELEEHLDQELFIQLIKLLSPKTNITIENFHILFQKELKLCVNDYSSYLRKELCFFSIFDWKEPFIYCNELFSFNGGLNINSDHIFEYFFIGDISNFKDFDFHKNKLLLINVNDPIISEILKIQESTLNYFQKELCKIYFAFLPQFHFSHEEMEKIFRSIEELLIKSLNLKINSKDRH